jgi:uncharacterized LabA/DUF88 family protein
MIMKKNILPMRSFEKTALFIDGANLYSATRGLGFDIDYKKLYDVFDQGSHLIRAFYYTAITDEHDFSPVRPLVDWLDYNGYTLITKPAKTFTDANGRSRIKGNMDIELAIDMMEMSQYIDHAFLFSGDGDFRRLVEIMQRRGVRVSVISTLNSSLPMISDELRRQADCFIDLCDIQPLISRHKSDKTEKTEIEQSKTSTWNHGDIFYERLTRND